MVSRQRDNPCKDRQKKPKNKTRGKSEQRKRRIGEGRRCDGGGVFLLELFEPSEPFKNSPPPSLAPRPQFLVRVVQMWS
jgi:hypothetical protein